MKEQGRNKGWWLGMNDKMTKQIKITKKDIPWLEQTILDARYLGHNRVADIIAKTLQELLHNGE